MRNSDMVMSKRLAVAALALGCALAALPAGDPAFAQDGMAPGIYRAYVQGIQQALAEHGFDAGPADGRMGGKTERAIRAYQKKAGLPVDGKVSQSLLDHIKFTQPRIEADGRKSAARKPDATVREIQTLLAERGYRPGPVDGFAGGRTADAARAYQKDSGLPETGKLDQALLDSLRQAKAGAPVTAPAQ
jgi:peptidoglycan hydrolase-like protein with peptidoglycan-binding domain